MKLMKISLVMVILAIFLVGSASADTALIIGDSWVDYNVPAGTPPVPSSGNHFTYESENAAHIMITDLYCLGDQPAVYENNVLLGTGSSVVSTFDPQHPTVCSGPYASDPEVAYAGAWSHTCINMPKGPHAFDIKNIQMWDDGSADGGAVKVVEGDCPPTPVSSPEFPTLALPAGLIIGMLSLVFFIRRTRED
jgi:hypothetical protein